jgi:hypothetical protein
MSCLLECHHRQPGPYLPRDAYRRDEPRRFSVSSRADGSIALLGSLSTTMPGSTLRRSWRYFDDSPSRFTLVLADGGRNPIGIEAVSSTDLLPELVEILDDGIPAFHDRLLTGSSSGVQMIGGLRPSERQTVSIVPRIVAFARCLQFHVSRYVISWAAATPMWKASTVLPFRSSCRSAQLIFDFKPLHPRQPQQKQKGSGCA